MELEQKSYEFRHPDMIPQTVPLLPHQTLIVTSQRRHTISRVVKTFLIAFVVLLSIREVNYYMLHSGFSFGYGPNPTAEMTQWTHEGSSIPTYHDLTRSNPETSFYLPLNAQKILVIAGGTSHIGAFKIESSRSDDIPFDKMKVLVTINEQVPWRAPVKVCLAADPGDVHRVGVFNFDTSWQHSRYPIVTIHVVLPANPVIINNLQASFSHNYKVDFTGLNDSVLFNDLKVSTSNAPIDVKVLKALGPVYLNTRNGRIKGHFDSTDNLWLETTNAPIEVSIDLRSKASATVPVMVNIQSTNGHIYSTYNLHSDETRGGIFSIHAHSSNSEIKLFNTLAPVDSKIHLTALTSNAGAAVHMNPAYEGRYTLKTSNSATQVDIRDAQDPSGSGRRRENYTNGNHRSIASGSVGWSREGAERGTVDITSSNAHVSFSV